MASLGRLCHPFGIIARKSLFSNSLTVQGNVSRYSSLHEQAGSWLVREFSTSPRSQSLKDFFDNPKTYAELNITVGRSWGKEELRTKCNEDLHKLWYVLLKEMNMLLTMKAEYERAVEQTPSIERLEKGSASDCQIRIFLDYAKLGANVNSSGINLKQVEVSMDNLQDIVSERNKAVGLLEQGELPHPKWIDDTDELGRPIRRLEEEHLIPKEHNADFIAKYDNIGDLPHIFQPYIDEQQLVKKKSHIRKRNVLRRKLEQKYPHLEKDRRWLNEYCSMITEHSNKNPDLETLIAKSEES